MSKNAKTGSKNNPLARTTKAEYYYPMDGKRVKVKPALLYAGSSRFMVAELDDGSFVCNPNKQPMPWKSVVVLCSPTAV